MAFPFDEVLILVNGVFEELDELVVDFVDTIDASFAAFPNIFRVVDLWVQYFTGLVGRVLTIPLSGSERQAAELIKSSRWRTRATSAEGAIRIAFEAPKKFITFITLTDDNGLLTVIAGWLARWIYRAFKRVNFILKLIGAAQISEAEIAKVILEKWLKKATFYKTTAIIIGGFYVLAYAATRISAMGIAFAVLDGTAEKWFWSQDSKRFWSRKSGSFRRNKRAGPDR